MHDRIAPESADKEIKRPSILKKDVCKISIDSET